MVESAPTHLAQANLAWMRYPLHDRRMTDMRDEIDRINRLGDHAVGFIWRFQTDQGDATDVRVLDDPRVLFNLTIWRSVDDLRRYVYRTEHTAFLRRRRDWFLPPPKPPLAMWWVPAGTRPTVADGMARLQRLWRDGPSFDAFTLSKPYGFNGKRLTTPAQ